MFSLGARQNTSHTGPEVSARLLQALSKRGVEVAYVGNTSTVLAVGGYCPRYGNLLIWDALAPAAGGPASRLPHHAALVTAIQVAPCLVLQCHSQTDLPSSCVAGAA